MVGRRYWWGWKRWWQGWRGALLHVRAVPSATSDLVASTTANVPVLLLRWLVVGWRGGGGCSRRCGTQCTPLDMGAGGMRKVAPVVPDRWGGMGWWPVLLGRQCQCRVLLALLVPECQGTFML